VPHDHHAPRSPAPPRTGMGSLLARGSRPIHNAREPLKEPVKRAFHQAIDGTG
jgi:hypothetical protein